MKKYLWHFLLLFLLFSGIKLSVAQQSGLGLVLDKNPINVRSKQVQRPPVNPIFNGLPLFKKIFKSQRGDATYPFGAGITSFYYKQKYFASALWLTSVSPITGDTIHAWADTLIQNTHANESQLYARPNLWLFPFLNVYGIIGYSSGVVSPNLIAPKIIVDFPGLGEQTIDTTIKIMDKLPYNGPLYGGGVTLAMGFRHFFFSADYHYTVIIPENIETRFTLHTFTPKAGMIFTFSKMEIDFWLGAMYFSNKQTMHGEVNVKDFSETLAKVIGDKADYTGNIDPVHTWNFLAGALVEISSRHRLLIEGGFVHRTQVKIGYEFRF